MPGIVAAGLLVAVPTMGEYVIPEIMSQNNLALQNGMLGLRDPQGGDKWAGLAAGGPIGPNADAHPHCAHDPLSTHANKLSQAEAQADGTGANF